MKYIKINIKSAYLPIAKMNKEGKTKINHLLINNHFKKGGDPVQKIDNINSEESAKHFVIDTKGDNSLTIDKMFALHPIINMLHCLFGCRPVSDRRYSCYAQISYIRDIAKNGFFKPAVNLEKVKTECIQASIAEFNSHRKITYMDWQYLELFFNKKYNKAPMKCKFKTIPFDDLINTIFNKIALLSGHESYNDISCISALKIIGANENLFNELKSFFNELEIKNLKVLYNLMTSDKNDINQYNYWSSLLNIMRPLSVMCINGSFYFPVSDDDIKQLSKGKLCCSYLDGGLAEIELDDYNDIKVFDNINDNYFKTTDCITLSNLRK